MSSNAVVNAILGVTSNTRVREAMLLGSDLESSWSTTAVGDQGTSFGPFQIHLPAHPGVTSAEAENPSWAAHYMLGAYEAGVNSVSPSLWSSNPELAAEEAAFAAERPAQNYFASDGSAVVNAKWAQALAALGGHAGTGGNPGGGAGGGNNAQTTSLAGSLGLNPLTWLPNIPTLFNALDFPDMMERLGLIVLGGLLVLLGVWILAGHEVARIVLGESSPAAEIKKRVT